MKSIGCPMLSLLSYPQYIDCSWLKIELSKKKNLQIFKKIEKS